MRISSSGIRPYGNSFSEVFRYAAASLLRIAGRKQIKRQAAISRATSAVLEGMEPRQLLSATIPTIGTESAAIWTGITVNHTLVPASLNGKVGARVWASLQGGQTAGELAKLGVRVDSQGRVQTQIRVSGSAAAAADALTELGVRVDRFNADMHAIQAWIPRGLLDKVARLPQTAMVDIPDYAVTRTGSVLSAGDSVLRASQERSNFGFTGTGVKVGVISNGVDHKALVGSDLSTVTVDPDLPGSGDEGTAMLEIIHDLAPDAQLYFSGPTTAMEMVDAIQYLRDQGCTVIVDDLGFFLEPYFTDGDVATAAQNAVDAGVTYVTAAGNDSMPAGYYGTSHYQGQFVDNGSGFHNFASTGTDIFKTITVDAYSDLNVVLQWSDSFQSSSNDYNLYIYDSTGTNLIASNTTHTGIALRSLSITNVGSTPANVKIKIEKASGALSRELELFTYSAAGRSGALNYSTTGDAIFGQAAVTGVITVAASDASDGTHDIEIFSSRGASTIYTNFATQTKTTRQSLDVTATDGVQTEVGVLGYFWNPFYGTSAAAPHAAAIAALVRQANTSLTPAQVETKLTSTATDLKATGYDADSGYGLVQADRAVAYALFTLSGSSLTINGTSLADTITLSLTGSNLSVDFNGQVFTYPYSSISAITINGNDGNDTLTVSSAITLGVTLNGNNGNDTLSGGSGNDTLDGGAGTDVVTYASRTAAVSVTFSGSNAATGGQAGEADSITNAEWFIGGSGNDTIDAHLAGYAATLQGAGGDDHIVGTPYADNINGGAGNDTMDGGLGDDTMSGGDGQGAGTDTVDYSSRTTDLNIIFDSTSAGYGGESGENDFINGTEIVIGGSGNDWIAGVRTTGTDVYASPLTLYGNGGDDTLLGGSADDHLYGGTDNDFINGGAGNDTMDGGLGDDTMSGGDGQGAGTDTVDYSSRSNALTITYDTVGGFVGGEAGESDYFNGTEIIIDGSGNDTIKAQATVGATTYYFPTALTIYGNNGNDNLAGGSANDTLIGGSGNDTLDGAGGNDVLFSLGDGSIDTLIGGSGTDTAHKDSDDIIPNSDIETVLLT